MSSTVPKTKRVAKRSVKPTTGSHAPRRSPSPPLARPRTDIKIDMSRREAFLLLPLEERRRRIEAFRQAFAPVFADYSVDDFLADRRREAESED